MAAYTNMAWPEDPYGTGQLWRKEPLLLVGFAACRADDDDSILPVGYAVVYLRLHRTQPVEATNGVLFGFRAMGAVTEAELAELIRLLDLDAMRARRLAKIIAGHRLADDLRAVDVAIRDEGVGRGVRSLAEAWDHPERARDGMATTFDIAHRFAGQADLADVAAASAIDTATVRRAFQPQDTLDLLFEGARGIVPRGTSQRPASEDALRTQATEALAAYATERALVGALVAARQLDRYTWRGDLDIGGILAANAWDCFTSQDFSPREQPA